MARKKKAVNKEINKKEINKTNRKEINKKEINKEEILVKDIPLKDIESAAAVLAENFQDDAGMKALFSSKDPGYREKLYHWFGATLKLQLQNRQPLWGIYKGSDTNGLIGLAMVSNASIKPSASSMLRWIASITLSCGLGTLIKTIRHDQSRQAHFINNKQHQQLILEFIAVDTPYQGQGLGSLLMKKLQAQSLKLSKPIWLETTKPKNIKIFEKAGFALTYKKEMQGVVYFMMVYND